jgi:hypothetical protein
MRPMAGDNFYRLKVQLSDGTILYSLVQKVEFPKSEFVLFPNPNVGDMIYLSLNAYSGLRGNIEVLNALGQPIISRDYESLPEGTFDFGLNNLVSGTYFLKVKTDRREAVQVFVVQQK